MPLRRRPQGNRVARGRGARGRGRGTRARGARSAFIRASELPANYQGGQQAQQAQVKPQQPRLQIAFWPWDMEDPFDYDFDMDQALMEIRGLPNGHQFKDEELEEYITERLADYEHARAEMPAEHPLFHMENKLRTLYRFYPDVDWLQMPALPRICSKTNGNVDGQIVRPPLRHKGLVCTFARHNLRSMRCDLCTGDDTAAHKLGKEREKQVRRLKVQWTEEQDGARREELMNQMTALLQGTLHLGEIGCTNQFVLVTARNLKQADASFTTEESIDFILHFFVDGYVMGKGQPLTEVQRNAYFQRLETEAFHSLILVGAYNSFGHPCPIWPHLTARYLWMETLWIIPTPIKSQSALRGGQISFFGAEPNRDDYVQSLSNPSLDANNNLVFEGVFAEMNEIIQQFLAASPQERYILHQNVGCLVPVPKARQIFIDISLPFRPYGRGGGKPSVNDFLNSQEVQSAFKAFRSRCAVSGINGSDFIVSLDRKIDSTDRYNWTDVNPILWSINHGNHRFDSLLKVMQTWTSNTLNTTKSMMNWWT